MAGDDPKVPSERKIPRREFLRLTGAALIAAPACSDDAIGASVGLGDTSTGEPGGSSTGTTGAPTTSGAGATSTGADASTGAEPTSTGDGTTGEGTTGEPQADMGAQPGACEGQEIAFTPDAVAEDLQRFPMAVIAGAMRQESALIHSFTTQQGPLVLRVWQPGGAPGTVRVIRELEVSPDANGYLRQVVDGLCPGEWYRYGFFAVEGGEAVARGVLGEFRTALAEGALEPVTVAISACNGGGNAPWPALQRTSDEYYDVFLHLGDMAYNDGSATLAEFRESWQEYLAVDQGGETGGFALAYARAGLYATLDDHEITNNFDPETISPAVFDAAMTSYFEAIPLTDQPDGFRVWQSFRWGDTAEFIVLDCRTERLPSTQDTAEATYISAEQMAWLKDRLKNSPCHFKVVLNSVPITDMPTIPWDLAQGDRWEGYPAQREDLLAFITAENIANVWFVSGDFHTCFVSQVQPGATGVLGKTREIAVTGGNTNVLGDFLDPPQFAFGTSQPHACLITFDPAADEVLVRFIDADTGQESYAATLTQK